MNTEDRLFDIFLAAAEMEDSRARTAYLDEACGPDAPLRRRVEALLSAESQAGVTPDALPPATVEDDAVSGRRIRHYKLLEKIGEGGFGDVWMAEQEAPVKRRVALKIIKLGMDTRQVVARFEAERQALAMMDHPHIATVHDAGATETGRPFFVMELVRGIPITDYCDENRLSTRERVSLFLPICLAVQHAHQKGIIHRDLKPSNILVTLHDGVPVPKVIDFGIVKAVEQNLTDKTVFTQFHHMIGTPAYMSPEQAEMSGLGIDTRSDIYSLGVLFYELLTGRTPLDGKEISSRGYDEMRRRIREEEPVKPSTRVNMLQEAERIRVARNRQTDPAQWCGELRGDLDWIVLKTLEKDRTRRYDTAKGLANDLRRYLNNEPVEAAPPDTLYLFRKYLVRHRTVVTFSTVVVLTLVTGTVLSLWLAIRATQARDAARASEQKALRSIYVADINDAEEAIASFDVYAARRELEKHVPRPGETREDLRGFEWWYLYDQLHSGDFKIFAKLPTGVGGLELSPNGDLLAAVSTDGLLKVWDFPSGHEVVSAELGAAWTKPVFLDDARLLYTEPQATNGMHVIRDLQSGEVRAVPRSLGVWWQKALHPDGRQILYYDRPATEEEEGRRVFDLETGESRAWHSPEYLGIEGLTVRHANSILFDVPEGRHFIVGMADGRIIAFDFASYQIRDEWQAHPESISALRFSPDGGLLASASIPAHEVIRLWDYPTHKRPIELKGHLDWISDLEFNADGSRLVSASSDGTVRLWDLRYGDVPAPWNYLGLSREVWEVEITPDDRAIIAGDREGTIGVWRISSTPPRTGSRLISTNVLQFAVSQSGDRIAVVHESGALGLGNITDEIVLNPAPYAGSDNRSLDFSDDGRRLIAGKEDGDVAVYDIDTARLLYEFKAHHVGVLGVRWLQNDELVLSIDDDKSRIVLHALKDGIAEVIWEQVMRRQEMDPFLDPFLLHTLPPISDDEKVMATCNAQGDLTFHDLSPGGVTESALRRISTREEKLRWLAVSPDASYVATGGESGVIRFWDLASGQERISLPGHSNVTGMMVFSRSGKRLVSAGGTIPIKIWDLETREELLSLDPGMWVNPIRFSSDEQWLLGLTRPGGELHGWHAPRQARR